MTKIKMSELYWISRIGMLHNFLTLILAISCACSIFFTISHFISLDIKFDEESYDGKIKIMVDKFWKRTLVSTFVIITLYIFVPSMRQIYLIYGLGGTIDYLTKDENAKKIPEKTINALNIFLDNELKKDSIKK
jgi:hypothetical protein